MPAGVRYVGKYPNSYSYSPGRKYCLIDKDRHNFEWSEKVKPDWELKGQGNVCGCGLLVAPNDKLAIFFTFNGKLIGDFLGLLVYQKKNFNTAVCMYLF
jgi:hypothetical protein